MIKFFCTQWKYSCKNDWTLQVKQDLSDFEISADFNELKKKSVKQLVRKKTKEFAFYTFLEKQASHSKLDNICYTELKLQDYLENMSANDAQTVFSYRKIIGVREVHNHVHYVIYIWILKVLAFSAPW